METNEKEFDEKQALQVVDEMISVVRNKIDDNSFLFLLWGWIVIIGNAFSYYWATAEKGDFIGYTWMILGPLGGMITGIYVARQGKKKMVRTYIDTMMAYLWISCFIALVMFLVFMVIGENYSLISPLILTITGIATLTTGGVLKFRPLIIGGLLFFVFSLGTFLISVSSMNNEIQFLLSAAAMTTGYLIPGYMLRAKYRSDNV